MIAINHLKFEYQDGVEVIKDLSLTIKKNEKITIVGKSGCGKTTLLFLLGYLLKPTAGEIWVEDEPLTSVRENTGIIFQNGGLYPWKNVEENLVLGLKSRGVSNVEIKERVFRVLQELDILDIRKKYMKQLSGGQRQRVAIARVLVLHSDLLLLDEPSSALDAMTKENFQNTLLKTYKNHNMTSIIVTHDIEEAVYLGEKIIIMKNGQVSEIIPNNLYGNEDVKNSLPFYQKCIEIRKKVN